MSYAFRRAWPRRNIDFSDLRKLLENWCDCNSVWCCAKYGLRPHAFIFVSRRPSCVMHLTRRGKGLLTLSTEKAVSQKRNMFRYMTFHVHSVFRQPKLPYNSKYLWSHAKCAVIEAMVHQNDCDINQGWCSWYGNICSTPFLTHTYICTGFKFCQVQKHPSIILCDTDLRTLRNSVHIC